MLSALEHLMRLHPASHFGRCWERPQTGLEIFEDLERPRLRPRYRYETDRHEPAWVIGQVAAAIAMLIVFCGVLTMIGRFSGDAPDVGRPAVEVSDAAEPR